MKEHRPSRKGSAPEKPQAKEEFDPGQGWEDTEELDKTRPGEDADDPDVADRAGTHGGVAKKKKGH
jgi:hypothetical protein